MFYIRKSSYLLLIVSVLILLLSCKKPINGREDFKETKELTDFEKIDIPLSAEPYCVRLLNDSAVLVNNTYWNNNICVELYSLKTKKRFSAPVVSGKYKHGIPDCMCVLNSNIDNKFRINVMCEKTIYTVNADSIIRYGKFSYESKFGYLNISDYHSDIFLIDSIHYVSYNSEYNIDSLYNNGYIFPLFKGGINPNSFVDTDSFYVNTYVNGALLFLNPKTKEIWSADRYHDKITIWNDSLKIVRTIDMHDNISPSYIINEQTIGDPRMSIKFKEREKRTFIDYYITSNYIYLAYIGNNIEKNNGCFMEIFKLDLDGNFICDYMVDHYIYSISVDKAENYLYCLSMEKGKRSPILLKYKL